MSQLHWTTRCPTGVTPKAFRFDPYGSSPAGKLFFIDESELRHDDTFENTVDQGDHAYFDEPSLFQHGPPVGTRHPMLWGRVSFVPYPDEEFVAPSLDASLEKKDELVRVFLGQLPYFVTDMQLSWLCYTFGLGNAVALPERIMKKQPNGERLPTGCIHAYTTIRAVEEMAAGMHKRMLVDDTGVWHARSDMELDALSSYVACMKSDRTKRVPGRPYDTVVVQLATSTFVPRHVAVRPELAATAISSSADVFEPVAPRRLSVKGGSRWANGESHMPTPTNGGPLEEGNGKRRAWN